jgi:hypothetical protein
MMLSNLERRMLMLYCSGSIIETIDTLRLALRDTTDPDERTVISGILRKLEDTGDVEVACYSESGVSYG